MSSHEINVSSLQHNISYIIYVRWIKDSLEGWIYAIVRFDFVITIWKRGGGKNSGPSKIIIFFLLWRLSFIFGVLWNFQRGSCSEYSLLMHPNPLYVFFNSKNWIGKKKNQERAWLWQSERNSWMFIKLSIQVKRRIYEKRRFKEFINIKWFCVTLKIYINMQKTFKPSGHVKQFIHSILSKTHLCTNFLELLKFLPFIKYFILIHFLLQSYFPKNKSSVRFMNKCAMSISM